MAKIGKCKICMANRILKRDVCKRCNKLPAIEVEEEEESN